MYDTQNWHTRVAIWTIFQRYSVKDLIFEYVFMIIKTRFHR